MIADDAIAAQPSEVNPLATLIARGRAAFTRLFPDQSFDATEWSLVPRMVRPSAETTRWVRFVRYGEPYRPLPEAFATVLKCWCVLDPVSAGSTYNRVAAGRLFFAALAARDESAAENFRWPNLSFDDLRRTETFLTTFRPVRRERFSASSVYRAMGPLCALSEYLYEQGVCRAVGYVVQTPHPRGWREGTFAGQEESAETKLPTETSIAALGAIYHDLTTAPRSQVPARDLYLISVVAILALTGLRIGELLTLPYACERISGGRGRPRRYGLAYYVEKSLRSKPVPDIRWISPTAEPIIRACVERLRRMTRAARERAWVLEQTPGFVPLLQKYAGRERLRQKEVAELLGVQFGALHQPRFRAALAPRKARVGKYYATEDVQRYLSRLLGTKLWTVDFKDGLHQPLSGTLLIAFHGFFRNKRRRSNRCIVRAVTPPALVRFLVGATHTPSIFHRHGMREPPGESGEPGRFCRITSHQFRHWLNTLAIEGGMDPHLITRYFGRKNPRDTDAYLHWTPQEAGSYARDAIKTGRVFGAVASTYWSLPQEQREDFLRGQVPTAHFTPVGVCVHNFDVEPCPLHLNCLKGCPDYCRTKGDPREREMIERLRDRTEALLQMAREAEEGGQAYASAWTLHHEEILEGCRCALAVDSAPGPEGMCRPFSNRPTRFLPVLPPATESASEEG